MRHSFKTGLASDKKDPSTNHGLRLDLDLRIENVLPTDNTAMRLYFGEHDIRRMLYSLVANDVCNHVCESVTKDLSLTSYKNDVTVEGNVHGSTESKILIPSGANKLSMENQITVSIEVTSPIELNIPQALYAMRSQVGARVSNVIVGVLLNRFLHIDDQETDINVVEHAGRLSMSDFSHKKSTAQWN